MAIYTSSGVKIAETSGNDIVLPDPGEVQELRRIADIAAKMQSLPKNRQNPLKERPDFQRLSRLSL